MSDEYIICPRCKSDAITATGNTPSRNPSALCLRCEECDNHWEHDKHLEVCGFCFHLDSAFFCMVYQIPIYNHRVPYDKCENWEARKF